VIKRGRLGGPKRGYERYKEEARVLVQAKLAHFNAHYDLVWGRVAIRNQRSRWGSCSKKGNLNFNYRIIQLPEHLQDYLVVHELCHLVQMNHSSTFWTLVAEVIPNYATCRRELRVYKT
jgi:predicted metal-dependent hydrolase